MRRKTMWPEAMGTFAALSSTALGSNTPLKTVPERPRWELNRWDRTFSVTPETQVALRLVGEVQEQWSDTQTLKERAVLEGAMSKGDFIHGMVDPQALQLAPALIEYEVIYDLEWDEETQSSLDVDDVDLEILPVEAVNV